MKGPSEWRLPATSANRRGTGTGGRGRRACTRGASMRAVVSRGLNWADRRRSRLAAAPAVGKQWVEWPPTFPWMRAGGKVGGRGGLPTSIPDNRRTSNGSPSCARHDRGDGRFCDAACRTLTTARSARPAVEECVSEHTRRERKPTGTEQSLDDEGRRGEEGILEATMGRGRGRRRRRRGRGRKRAWEEERPRKGMGRGVYGFWQCERCRGPEEQKSGRLATGG